MEWNDYLAAIQISESSDNPSVHIVERILLDKHVSLGYSIINTYCDLVVVEPFSERAPTDIDCETCIGKLEAQQAFWTAFWSSAEGVHIAKILFGFDKIERRWREVAQETEAFIRKMEAFNHLLQDCLKYRQPVFTLQLSDEVLL